MVGERWSGVVNAVLDSDPRRSSDQTPSTGLKVRWVGRQLLDGQSVPSGDELPHPGGEVDVQVVPDEHDRAAELLVGGDEQVAAVGPGEALASVAPAVVAARR